MHLFESPLSFSLHIETLAVESGESCIDVIIDHCKTNLIELEDIAPLVTPQLKAKLAIEMQTIGLLPKESSLF